MQEAEEQDTCRICSAPAEADQPLFHPCKCSGTIRYIHQDCLTTWLSHSKKKTCDVCKHPYSFTKVYAPDMPPRLPPVLLVRRLAQQAIFFLLFIIRAISVATIWLAVLPWATVWTWRMYFSMGESAAWWISNRTRTVQQRESINPFYSSVPATPSLPPSNSYIGQITSHPTWLAISADIFTGQIIASVIVLTFVAVFLLREWISQNARPGVFDDDGPVEERPPDPIVAPRARPAQLPILDEDETARLAARQFEAMQALDALRAREGTHGHLVGEGRNHGRTPLNILPVPMGKVSATGEEKDRFAMARARRRHEMVLAENSSEQIFTDEQRMRRRRRKRRKDLPPPTLAEEAEQSTFEFTFTAESLSQRRTTERQVPPEFRSISTIPHASESSGSIFPTVALEPPRGSIPYSLFAFTRTSDDVTSLVAASTPLPESRSPSPSPPSSPMIQSSADSSPSQSLAPSTPIRRPPLPPTIPLSPGSSPSSPLESPSLATYRAPEDLGDEPEAGPSNYASYFDERAERYIEDDETTLEDENLAEERDRYFPEAESASAVVATGVKVNINAEGAKRRGTDEEDEEDEEDPFNDNEEDDGQWEGIVMDDEDAEELAEPAIVERVAAAGAGARPRLLNAPPVAGAPPAIRPAADDAAQAADAADLNEEIEGNVEDDMEGAMEAIGMRGPIYGVLQNAALMVFVLDTAIGLGVWIPFTIGKSTALLSLDPPRLFQILHFPIRAIRIVTDPMVDLVVYVVMDLFLPPYIRLGQAIAAFFFRLFVFGIGSLLGESTANKTSNLTSSIYYRALELTNKPMELLASLTSPSNTSVVAQPAQVGYSSWLDHTLQTAVEIAEPYFAVLGRGVRVKSSQAKETYITLALGSAARDRVFAVVMGYGVVAVALALYLNLLTMGNVKTAGRAVRSAVREQLLVLKVATFIFIELVIFPLCCGVVLDVSTIWLFREPNVNTRVAFFYEAPLTATFYHWVAGTMFMYAFAVLLAASRSIMRPGAMWFVKDPQDQNSHPIRDILDRPTLIQLRKICISGLMYSVVVLLVVLSVGGLLVLGNKSIMPIKWKNREPLSNVPIDLLFLHLVLPYTMHYFRPRKASKKVASSTWKFFAHQFRLTSYFFGTRDSTEESSRKGWNYLNSSAERVKDGSFRRVPATDHIALPRDMRATVAVTETGEPLNNAARDLMMRQNTEAAKAKRDVNKDYMVVYIPPHFPSRVILFMGCMWTLGAFSLGTAVALPIQLGRSFFKLFIPEDVHDGYSFIVGFYLLWGCFIIGKAVDRLDKRRQRRGTEGPRADLRVLVLKRGLLWIAKISYMVLFLGIVIPTLISIVVDLYVILPIRFVSEPDLVPRIRVVDSWALGLLYVKIGLHAQRIQAAQRQPPHSIFVGIQQIIHNGWTRPDPVAATKDVIAPLTGGLIAMILLPGLVFTAARHLLPIPLDNKFLFVRVYPTIFALASFSRSSVVLVDVLSTWSQSVRDKEFLVEMRLRNHEPDNSVQEDAETQNDT